MCEPATLMAITAATTAVSGGIQYAAQRQQGYADRVIGEQNARVAEIQAEQARQTGSIEEARQAMRIRQTLGAQRAAIGGAGIEATGTAADVLGDTAGLGAADLGIMRSNALREAWGYQVSAVNERARGRQADRNARLQGFGTILGTTAQLAGQFRQSR
jgi:hypothetical protein